MCSSEVCRAWNGNLPNQYYPSQYMMDSYSSMPQTWSDCAASSSAPARSPFPVPLRLEQELIHPSHDPSLQAILESAMQEQLHDYAYHFQAMQPFACNTDDQSTIDEIPQEEKQSTDRELETAMRNAVAKFLEDPGGQDSDESDYEDLFDEMPEITQALPEQWIHEVSAASSQPAPRQLRSSAIPSQMPTGFTLQAPMYAASQHDIDKSSTTPSQIHADITSDSIAQHQAARTQLPSCGSPPTLPPTAFPDSSPGEYSLVACLKEILCEGSIPHDIRLVADDGQVGAHHFILMERSSFFRNRLQGGYTLEPWEPLPEYRITGVRLAVLQHILVYIYTNTCEASLDAIIASSSMASGIFWCMELYSAAASLGLTGLKNFLIDDVLGPVAFHFPSLALQRLGKFLSIDQSSSADAPDMNRFELPMYQQASANLPSSDTLWANEAQAHADFHHEQDRTGSQQQLDGPDLMFGNDQAIESSMHDAVSHPRVHASKTDLSEADLESAKQDASIEGKKGKLALQIRSQGATTLMIRNLPRTLKQKKFLHEINACGYSGTYDFAYLPSVFGKGFEASGLGYGFINFTDSEAIVKFALSWHGSRRFGLSVRDSAITVAPAEHQGKEINLEKWLRKGCRVRNPELRPYVKFDTSEMDPEYGNFFERLVAYMPRLKSMIPEANGPSHASESRSVEPTTSALVENNTEESHAIHSIPSPPGLLELAPSESGNAH